MKQYIHLVFNFLVAITFLSEKTSSARECLLSSEKLNEHFQTIQFKTMDMVWIVGKTTVLASATVRFGISGIYLKDNVEIFPRKRTTPLKSMRIPNEGMPREPNCTQLLARRPRMIIRRELLDSQNLIYKVFENNFVMGGGNL